jgi:hypothetical protein
MRVAAAASSHMSSSSSSSAALSLTRGNGVWARTFATKGGIEDRGHALEERAAREHDQQVLAALAKTLEAKKKKFASVEQGAAGTKEWRLFVTFGGERVSAWHDVPLLTEAGDHNLVVEMPKGCDKQMRHSEYCCLIATSQNLLGPTRKWKRRLTRRRIRSSRT